MTYTQYIVVMKALSKRDERVVIRIDKETKERLKQIAKKEDLPVSHIVRKALREYLKKVYK